ncbi:MAG: type II secretion system protein GspG, partial [Candidatus Latescibacteria bacterium]|nr:type II secretion system protein GspG [Candidatus Latescibacterota bacterium]
GPARKAMTYVENDEIGGWLEVPIKVEEAGDYSISIYQMLFRDYGTWRVIMKGPGFDQLLDPAMDFYDPYFIQTFNMPENYLYGTWHENKVGIYSLEPGSYTIRFECIGANPLARVRGVAYTQAGSRYIENRPAGQPGLNMALDGISFRMLPWEDTWGWMQDYLVREERLFAERIETADRTVQRLAEAIEAFKRDTDGYPHNLNELIERPPRLAGIRGNWPYMKFLDDEHIPLDPWGQHYRFLWPGRYNTGGFDVWSVHGNERDPSVWIGNWEK